tara:strand:- start:4074 stop:4355 length:282 start_codon:yes stop_codon:yes gene_type:complete
MNTFTKTPTAKTNAYKVTFDDGREINRNAKKDFTHAIIYSADKGPWKVYGLASDVVKAAKSESACRSDFRAIRHGTYFKRATPVRVEVLALHK